LAIENAGGNNNAKCLFSPSAWIKLHSLGSSHSKITRSTNGTS
jgi:hypothetical protein